MIVARKKYIVFAWPAVVHAGGLLLSDERDD